MKLLMKNLSLIAALSLSITGTAVAEGGKVVPIDPAPVCEAPFTGTVSVGYETTYLFRGFDFGSDAPWAGVDLNGQLLGLDLNIGAWYLNATDDTVDYDELDLYAYVALPDLGPFAVSAGGTWFYFAETATDGGELLLDLSTSLGPVDLGFVTVYDIGEEGWNWQLALGKTIGLGDCLDLVLGAGVSYSDSYYFDVTGWNHAFATAGLDFALTETTTLSTYIGGNFPLEDLADLQDNIVHGGASISVSF